MSDILAKVAAAHASPPSKLGRAARSTSAAVAMEAANTILEIAPVQMLRSYAVQIMANFLKQQDNNMRYVPRPYYSPLMGVHLLDRRYTTRL